MKRCVMISFGVFLAALLTSCSMAGAQHQSDWQQNLDSKIAYTIEPAQGVSIQSAGDRFVLQGKDRFRLVLIPAEGDVWNMESVSVLGLMLKNTGQTELVMDSMLGNKGAVPWNKSSLGRTIVKPGEQLPLAVAIGRERKGPNPHPAFVRMAGTPAGHFYHWNTIDPTQVASLVITSARKGDHRFELAQMFPLQKMDLGLLDDFPFIDKYGQYIHSEWAGKVHSDKDIMSSIAAEKKLEKELSEPTGFSQYGGWKDGPKLEATGHFRTEKYKGRWWFVDPDGCLFWSYGVNTVGVSYAGQTPTERDPAVFQDLPAEDDEEFGQFHVKIDVEDHVTYELHEDVPHYDFTRANLYRKYGNDWPEKYVEQDIKRLKYCHFNTVGAWSDDAIVAKRQVPYTAMVHYEYAFAALKLPDPFDARTREGLRKSLREYPIDFKNDPWCIGALVNNELKWENFSYELISNILSFKKEGTEVKKVFRDWLKGKYTTITALNEAWKTPFAGWDDLLKVTDRSVFSKADPKDCSALTTLFAEAFFKMVKEELNEYAPGTLYLGCRFNVVPREVVEAMAHYADVISLNNYSYDPQTSRLGPVDKPVLLTEFHFVNIAGKNLGKGLSTAQDVVQQKRMFRSYIKQAVDHPQIVGAHWFQWRDQNVGGRYDGENYDLGFFDIADVPNEKLIRAAEECGRNLYNVN